MSFRTALAISLLTLTTGVASTAFAKPSAADTAACTEHVKKMEGMKTKEERTSYCKGNEECTSHHCAKLVSHKSTKHTTPKPKTQAN